MRQPSHECYDVKEPEDAGNARRGLRRLGERAAVPAEVIQRAELAVTELATNLVRHAGGGRLLLRALAGPAPGLELLSVDRGPGIPDVALALADPDRASVEQRIDEGRMFQGLGVGLGVVRRAASAFEAWSRPGQGTVVLAQVGAAAADPGAPFAWGGLSVPMHAGDANGDAWAVRAGQDRLTLMMVDGLGHGPEAAKAAAAALDAFDEGFADEVLGVVARAHAAMRGTRGGSLAVARLDRGARRLEFCGVGNVTARVLGPGARRLVTRVGTLGLAPAAPRVKVDVHPWSAGATLLLHTDGVREHFDSEPYEKLLSLHPTVLAALVQRDHARGRDDAAVAAIRDRAA